MATTFTLGRFAEGAVKASGWWSPRGGEKVLLVRQGGNLIVCEADDETEWDRGIAYTWPRSENQHASRLAVRHYERRTGRDAFAVQE